MNRRRLFIIFYIWVTTVMLAACQSMSDRDTIGNLRGVQIEIKEEALEGGLEKAMVGYQRFLEETPDNELAPEAIRRLADLKIEKEYGTLTETAALEAGAQAAGLTASEKAARPQVVSMDKVDRPTDPALATSPVRDESEADFEKRATQGRPVAGAVKGADDLEKAGPLEAIALYTRLLNDYPLYDRNDQVLYQMSRAYEELGRIEEAMDVMDRMVRDYPGSRYLDEVQFRRAEYFFTHKQYLDAEDAYTTIANIGVGSSYYDLALYKLGWTFYKQELYEEALHRFMALLDYKVSVGHDFAQTEDETERKGTEDTFRVISLSFSNLGGADSVVEYFSRRGERTYEDHVYSHLGEFYFHKRRYADASATYNAFVSRNPFHKVAPNFHMRVIEIHAAGGFPSLVLDAKKAFATTYGLRAEYWTYFDPGDRPDVLGHLKTNLTDLANHYHACYQDARQSDDQPVNFKESLHWYREFLTSFPTDTEAPTINHHLADLLMENKWFGEAAVEYEKTAYDYPHHEKASEAGYTAVFAYRAHLAAVAPENNDSVKQEVVRSSLKFADAFPEHEKAAIVLGAAADDLYVMKAFERALAAANKLLAGFPDTDVEVVRSAWLVIGHSSYELSRFSEAETAYLSVLALLPADGKTRDATVDNLAASIYKQGEQANAAQDYRAAADHFLRVGRMAPTSKIRASAEFDGAGALIQLKDWDMAATVLAAFRDTFPEHPLQPEVTKKIAYVYRENGRLSMAAGEYERIETESGDDDIRREALLVAAELYAEDGNSIRALAVSRRYVGYFPQPVAVNLETRNKIAIILKTQNDREAYLKELREIVTIDAAAGPARTARTRYLAAKAALVLAESRYDQFVAVRLVKPIKVTLPKKQARMKAATKAFNRLMDYEVGEVTAAATFYLAEIYAHFSIALMTSERPEGLNPMESEQYELAIEEQAYPFEEQAINVHESNLKLISLGVYNEWVDKSLQKLAEFVPVRYDKPEAPSDIVSSLETYILEIERPPAPGRPQASVAAAVSDAQPGGASEAVEDPGAVKDIERDEQGPVEEPGAVEGIESEASFQAEEPEMIPVDGVVQQGGAQGVRLDGAVQ